MGDRGSIGSGAPGLEGVAARRRRPASPTGDLYPHRRSISRPEGYVTQSDAIEELLGQERMCETRSLCCSGSRTVWEELSLAY